MMDGVYAQVCDAFGQIETQDWRTGEHVVIGSQTEDFGDAVEDVQAYVDWAEQQGYARMAFEGGAHLWIAGSGEPCAYVEASVFANEGHAGYDAFAADALQDVLGIPAGRVYVRFSDIPVWSVGDMVVDRRMY